MRYRSWFVTLAQRAQSRLPCPVRRVRRTRVKLASYNINNIEKRLPTLQRWLHDAKPDASAVDRSAAWRIWPSSTQSRASRDRRRICVRSTAPIDTSWGGHSSSARTRKRNPGKPFEPPGGQNSRRLLSERRLEGLGSAELCGPECEGVRHRRESCKRKRWPRQRMSQRMPATR